jgi:hypothetical protein
VFYNLKKVSSLYSRLKAPTEKLKRSEVVYKIPCVCGRSYVGQTRQWLEKRVYQHKYDCRAINVLNKDHTALAKHHFETSHNFLFDNVEILDAEPVYNKRCVSEMIHITLNDTVNQRTDTSNLSNMYINLLSLYKRRNQRQ